MRHSLSLSIGMPYNMPCICFIFYAGIFFYIEQKEDKGNSSDEDISWRIQQGHEDEQDDNCKSLRDELPKVSLTVILFHSNNIFTLNFLQLRLIKQIY